MNFARRFAPIDIATLLYVTGTTAALLLFGRADRAAAWLLTAHVLVVSVVLLAPRLRQAGPFGQFMAEWYSIIMVTALYAEIGVLNLGFGHHHDAAIQQSRADGVRNAGVLSLDPRDAESPALLGTPLLLPVVLRDPGCGTARPVDRAAGAKGRGSRSSPS